MDVGFLYRNDDEKKRFKDIRYGDDTNLFYGEIGMRPDIYSKSDISGVSKRYSNLHATPITLKMSEGEKEVALAKLAVARDGASKVAGQLISELLG